MKAIVVTDQVAVDFVRAVIEQESGWHRYAISKKGAADLMQLMPDTRQKTQRSGAL